MVPRCDRPGYRDEQSREPGFQRDHKALPLEDRARERLPAPTAVRLSAVPRPANRLSPTRALVLSNEMHAGATTVPENVHGRARRQAVSLPHGVLPEPLHAPRQEPNKHGNPLHLAPAAAPPSIPRKLADERLRASPEPRLPRHGHLHPKRARGGLRPESAHGSHRPFHDLQCAPADVAEPPRSIP